MPNSEDIKFAKGYDPNFKKSTEIPNIPDQSAIYTNPETKELIKTQKNKVIVPPKQSVFDHPVNDLPIKIPIKRYQNKIWKNLSPSEKIDFNNQVNIFRNRFPKEYIAYYKKLHNDYLDYFKKNPEFDVQGNVITHIGGGGGNVQDYSFKSGDHKDLYVPNGLYYGNFIGEKQWRKFAPTEFSSKFLNNLLANVKENKYNKYKNFFDAIKNYLIEKNQLSDFNKDVSSPDILPTEDILSKYRLSKIEREKYGYEFKLADYAKQNVNNVNDEVLAMILKLFMYRIMPNLPLVYNKYQPLLQTIEKKVLDSGVVKKVGDEYLFPDDIIFYEKYKDSEFIGETNENIGGLKLSYIEKTFDTKVTKTKSGVFDKYMFNEKDTNNIVEYWAWYAPNKENFDVLSVLDKLKDSINRQDKTFIVNSGIIVDTQTYKGVKRTSITIDNLSIESDKKVGSVITKQQTIKYFNDLLDMLKDENIPVPKSIAFKNTDKVHTELLEKLKEAFNEAINELIENQDTVPTYKNIINYVVENEPILAQYFNNPNDSTNIFKYVAKEMLPDVNDNLQNALKTKYKEQIKRLPDLFEKYANSKNYEGIEVKGKTKIPILQDKEAEGILRNLSKNVKEIQNNLSDDLFNKFKKIYNALIFYSDKEDSSLILKDNGELAKKLLKDVKLLANETEKENVVKKLQGKFDNVSATPAPASTPSKYDLMKQKLMGNYKKSNENYDSLEEGYIKKLLNISNYKRVI